MTRSEGLTGDRNMPGAKILQVNRRSPKLSAYTYSKNRVLTKALSVLSSLHFPKHRCQVLLVVDFHGLSSVNLPERGRGVSLEKESVFSKRKLLQNLEQRRIYLADTVS